jgi:hypothetical protein
MNLENGAEAAQNIGVFLPRLGASTLRAILFSRAGKGSKPETYFEK